MVGVAKISVVLDEKARGYSDDDADSAKLKPTMIVIMMKLAATGSHPY